MSDKDFKSEMEELEKRLSRLQQKIKELNIPVLIVFEGWSSAGKGTNISRVLHPLDPRGYSVYTLNKIPEDAVMRPFLWNFWTKTPAKGRITIFDQSWYSAILPENLSRRPLSSQSNTRTPANCPPRHAADAEIGGFYYDVNAFERQLSDDGTLIIKLFLHISKKEQKKRFERLLGNPDTKWRVNAQDIKQNKEYDKYLKAFESIIQQGNFGFSEWNIIEANDKNYATVKIYKVIISQIEDAIRALTRAQRPAEDTVEPTEQDPDAPAESAVQIPLEAPQVSILSSVDPNQNMSGKEYREQLAFYQEKVSYLGFKLYTKRRPVVILYEGWDAAGKGGNIRRLTQELDPRGYEVVPIAAPSQDEINHHYLWRFWKAVPKDGHIAIFDRTWYGRVMVERIEGLCSDDEWSRAYREINDMELHLHNHGAILFKFWLHIDQEEQLSRFNSRAADPLKQYKITDEDWRNREKWSEYEKAIDEMLFRTSTPYAPWTVVESNNKRFARIKTLKLVADTLEQELK